VPSNVASARSRVGQNNTLRCSLTTGGSSTRRSSAPCAGANEVQLDLFGDHKRNVALYPAFQGYFLAHEPPFLAAWRKNDPFFLPAGC
jgi:hypothetical protein